MSRWGSFPDFSRDLSWDKQSAREHQTMSDAAKASAQAGVGHGMTRRGATPSVVQQPKPAAPRAVKIVAVVGKPNPAFHELLVREVTFAYEGADYVPPDSMPEDPPPIEPVPAILRWKGEPFFALPGYNHSVAEFSSTWFSDLLRDDAGELVLDGDGKTMEQFPDETTTLHLLMLRPSGLPILLKMGGGGDTGFAVVRSIGPPEDAHTSYVVWAQAIRRIANWPPEPPDPPPENPPDPPLHGGWEFVGEAVEVATSPGIPAIYYAPFVWDSDDIVFPDIPILRTFSADGETYLEQTMRWATVEVPDNVRLSACTPIARRTEEMP